MQSQKRKTGVGILRTPAVELKADQKFQGELLQASITAGEELAFAALSSELLVCRVAEIPPHEQHRYLGRSQYPKFKNKSMVAPTFKEYKYNCPHMLFWRSISTTHKFLISAAPTAAPCLLQEAEQSLVRNLHDAVHHMPAEPDVEVLALFNINSTPISDPTLRHLFEESNKLFAFFTDGVIKKARQGWVDHVRKQLASRGGSLFKFISKQDKQFLNVDVGSKGGTSRDPSVFLDQQQAMWTKFWAPGTPDEEEVEHDNIHTLLTGLRQHALLEPPDPPVTPSCYNSALKVYRNDTKGSDNWTSSELKALPDHSKSELSNALNNAHLNIAQPHQHLIGLHSCLGKPSSDIRTICKTLMLYRMMCRIDRSIKNWEKLHAQSYDSAKAGSSAARSALFRNLSSEIAMWLGKPSAAVFNDYHKFFDTIDIPTLVSQAIHTQFPMRELAFAIQQHLAPRVIQVSGFCSKPTKVYKSMLPGCKHAVAFTRTLLMNSMTSIVSSHEDVDTHVHVDDTTMFVSADTQSEIQDLIVE